MGFIIQFNRFFSVTMMDAELDKPIEKFRFFADSDTQRILRNHNLLFRPSDKGFEVYYSSTPFIPLSGDVRFTFGFDYSDNRLYERYGLIKTGGSDPLIYEPALCFDNLADDGSIIAGQGASLTASGSGPEEHVTAADTGTIYGQTFTLVQAVNDSTPEHYTLKPRYRSSPEQTIAVNVTDDVKTVQTIINPLSFEDDYMSEPGPYTLKTSPSVSNRNIYLHNELAGRSAMGVVDIYWDTTQDTVAEETGQQYYITFKPK